MVCPGLAGDSSHPQLVAFVQWFGGHDSAGGSWVSVPRESHGGPHGRCSTAVGHASGQHGLWGIIGPVLSPVPCQQPHCLQNSADRLLLWHHKFWTNYYCSPYGKCREIKLSEQSPSSFPTLLQFPTNSGTVKSLEFYYKITEQPRG